MTRCSSENHTFSRPRHRHDAVRPGWRGPASSWSGVFFFFFSLFFYELKDSDLSIVTYLSVYVFVCVCVVGAWRLYISVCVCEWLWVFVCACVCVWWCVWVSMLVFRVFLYHIPMMYKQHMSMMFHKNILKCPPETKLYQGFRYRILRYIAAYRA